MVIIGLTKTLGLTGIDLLIGPLLIAGGATASAIMAGVRSPWAVFALLMAIIVGFIVLKFLNPWGVGAVL